MTFSIAVCHSAVSASPGTNRRSVGRSASNDKFFIPSMIEVAEEKVWILVRVFADAKEFESESEIHAMPALLCVGYIFLS